MSNSPFPSDFGGDIGAQIEDAFNGMGGGLKEASEARTRETVQRQGYVGFRNPFAASAFRDGHPGWGDINVDGEVRFFPPGVKPTAHIPLQGMPSPPPMPVNASEAVPRATVEKDGYVAFRSERLVRAFKSIHPDWGFIVVDGETRFFPPGVKPTASFSIESAPPPPPSPPPLSPSPSTPSPPVNPTPKPRFRVENGVWIPTEGTSTPAPSPSPSPAPAPSPEPSPGSGFRFADENTPPTPSPKTQRPYNPPSSPPSSGFRFEDGDAGPSPWRFDDTPWKEPDAPTSDPPLPMPGPGGKPPFRFDDDDTGGGGGGGSGSGGPPPPGGGGGSGGGSGGGGSGGSGGGSGSTTPFITSVSPHTNLSAGDNVCIRGHNLDNPTNCEIGGMRANIIHVSSRRELWITIPSGCKGGTLTLTTANGTARSPQALTVQNQGRSAVNPTGLKAVNIAGQISQRAISTTGGVVNAFSVGNIMGGGGPLESAVGGILGGASSILNSAFQIGAQIGQTLLSGVLTPFGRSGSAVGGLLGQVAGTGGGLLQSGAGLLSQGFGSAVQAGGGVLSAGASAAGGVLQGVGGALGMIPYAGVFLAGIASLGAMALNAIAGFITSVIKVVTDAINTAFKFIGDTFGKLGELAVGVLKTVSEVVQDVMGEVRRIVGEAKKLAVGGALPFDKAMGISEAFSPFGLGNTANQMFGSSPFAPMTQMMRNSINGLPDAQNDPNGFLVAYAKRYESVKDDPMRLALNNAMIGPGAQELNQNVGFYGAERVGRIAHFQEQFGLNPQTMRELDGSLMEAGAMITTFASRIKAIFAESLIPLVQEYLPKAFDWILSNKDNIVNAVRGVGEWLVKEAPPLFMRFGAIVLGVMGSFLEGLGGFAGYLKQHWGEVLGVLDSFLNGLRQFIVMMGGMASALMQFLYNVYQSPLVQQYLKSQGVNPAAASSGGAPGTGTTANNPTGGAPSKGTTATSPSGGAPANGNAASPAGAMSSPGATPSLTPNPASGATAVSPTGATPGSGNSAVSPMKYAPGVTPGDGVSAPTWKNTQTGNAITPDGKDSGMQLIDPLYTKKQEEEWKKQHLQQFQSGVWTYARRGGMIGAGAGALVGGLPGAAAGLILGAAGGAWASMYQSRAGDALDAPHIAYMKDRQAAIKAFKAQYGQLPTGYSPWKSDGGASGTVPTSAVIPFSPGGIVPGATPSTNGSAVSPPGTPGSATSTGAPTATTAVIMPPGNWFQNAQTLTTVALPQKYRDPGTAYTQTTAALEATLPYFNLRGAYENDQGILNGLDSMATGAPALGAKLLDKSRGLDAAKEDYSKRMLDALEKIEGHTGDANKISLDMLRATYQFHAKMGDEGGMENLMARILAYFNEDAAIDNLRA